MVLSNKKLKQKLRDELANSLAASVAGTDSINNKPTNSDQNRQPQLKELLDSVSHKPRFSKREKRRKSLTSSGLESSGIEINDKKEVELVGDGESGGRNEEGEKKERKRRKRDNTKRGLESGGDKEGDKVAKEGKKMSKKKRKDKKKKAKKKKAVATNEEEKGEAEEPAVKETHVDSNIQVNGVVPRKIYVGGIPFHYTEDDIRSYFKGCGSITEVDCMILSEDGKFSGIAFITFETEDAAKRALALDRAAMGDRYLTIQQYVKTPSERTSDFAPEMVEGYYRIYVGNLSWDTTEHDLRKLFSDCVITSIRLGKNKETGEFKGYAHVNFKDGVSVVMALKLDQQIVHGRPVKISCAVPKKGGTTGSRSDETNNVVSGEETNMDSRSVAAISEANTTDGLNSVVSSGKIRRRTCYECGEKGHLSSACPKKQNADITNSNAS